MIPFTSPRPRITNHLKLHPSAFLQFVLFPPLQSAARSQAPPPPYLSTPSVSASGGCDGDTTDRGRGPAAAVGRRRTVREESAPGGTLAPGGPRRTRTRRRGAGSVACKTRSREEGRPFLERAFQLIIADRLLFQPPLQFPPVLPVHSGKHRIRRKEREGEENNPCYVCVLIEGIRGQILPAYRANSYAHVCSCACVSRAHSDCDCELHT